TYAWRFSRGHYFQVYPKTAVALQTLEGYLGHERMMAAIGAYARTWKFKHPHAQDFFDAVSASAGEDLMWFFRPAFLGTDVLDYEITEVHSEPKGVPLGLFDDKEGKRTEVKKKNEDRDKGPYESEVLVHRRGDFVFPVEVEVHFSEGKIERVKWDGRD